MSTRINADGDYESDFTLRTGRTVELICNDEGTDVESFIDGKAVGSMRFRRIDVGVREPDECLKLCEMDVEGRFRRNGIGERMLKLAKEVSGLAVVASCPLNTESLEDGSHLIGDGGNFVTEMRNRGLIEEGCEEPCYCV